MKLLVGSLGLLGAAFSTTPVETLEFGGGDPKGLLLTSNPAAGNMYITLIEVDLETGTLGDQVITGNAEFGYLLDSRYDIDKLGPGHYAILESHIPVLGPRGPVDQYTCHANVSSVFEVRAGAAYVISYESLLGGASAVADLLTFLRISTAIEQYPALQPSEIVTERAAVIRMNYVEGSDRRVCAVDGFEILERFD